MKTSLIAGARTVLLLITLLFSVVIQAENALKNTLRMVVIDDVTHAEIQKLRSAGLDVTAVKERPVSTRGNSVAKRRFNVELVVSPGDSAKLKKLKLYSRSRVRSFRRNDSFSNQDSVFKNFDDAGTGIRAQLQAIGSAYPALTELINIGQSVQGRPILALRITNEAVRPDSKPEPGPRPKPKLSSQRRRGPYESGSKPQALFHATTHAREWVSTEMAMRLIRYLTDNFEKKARVTRILNRTEIWIVPVVNPDGYQFTFTNERLWRKNLRDNDGDGRVTFQDGVDLNRNYPRNWGRDDEGSSPDPADPTYRGSNPASEPETIALMKLIEEQDFKFSISYHTYGDLILYPWGFQAKTKSFDHAIFVAQAGTDRQPAIQDSIINRGYDPGVGADLYATNGDYTDWAYGAKGVLSYTVELTAGHDADGIDYGFEFPDDEDQVQQVFSDNLEFALTVAESARTPAKPRSAVGRSVEDIYHRPVRESFGQEQLIEVLARNDSEPNLLYKVNGVDGTVSFEPQFGKSFNKDPGVYFSRFTATIPGQMAGASVTYSITGRSTNPGASRDLVLGPYTYAVPNASGNPILILAAEDYSGRFPDYSNSSDPNYLKFYTDALDAGGYGYDVWDIDKQGVPSYVDVLSHYKVVVWYTGDDVVATVPHGTGTQEREVLQIRDFLNYADGRLFATGQNISYQAAVTGQYSDDFFQYALGADFHFEGAGQSSNDGLPFGISGIESDPVLGGFTFALSGGTGANNQTTPDSFVPVANNDYHHVDMMASYAGGAFEPHTGDYYVYSQIANSSYARWGRSVTVPTEDPTLKFWISGKIERDWDYAFVEVCAQGSDDCTTLADVNGGTQPDTGLSCPTGWVNELHPFLAHYVDELCNPTGSTGEWNAFTGTTGGWREVEMDLTPYVDQNVDIYFSYVTDWSNEELGLFIDDISVGGASPESFESGAGGWEASVPPGASANIDWVRIDSLALPESPALRTDNTIYFGFGLEAIDTDENRWQVLDRVLQYLLPTNAVPVTGVR